MSDDPKFDPWEHDLLGFRSLGETYTNLVQSIEDDSKVLSIEAGFGRGKTFFRRAWAQHLRDKGEIVVEIDAQQSDHSGDPVVTFLGALVSEVPEKEQSAAKEAFAKGKKYVGVAARTVTRVMVRNAAEELIDEVAAVGLDKVEGIEVLEDTVNELGKGMSKLAGNLISAQLAAEQVRQKEMPAQLMALRQALTEGRETDRVVILIDELDRCHPDYAIALLEAMKLVFDQLGYVFCLLVNADYLENLAAHRFGNAADGERYLDKFVDIRLRLPASEEAIASAARSIASSLPLKTPFGDGDEFTVERAAELAGELAPLSGLSMRQIERVLLRVELALRCYPDVPLDCPLLIFLAFSEAVALNGAGATAISDDALPRVRLTPEIAERLTQPVRSEGERENRISRVVSLIRENCSELLDLPSDRYRMHGGRQIPDWARVGRYLALHYLPTHERVLAAVHSLEVPDKDS